mmetsp:Transcript_97035/g.296567  ORF Transcript_97035/g.296567 Transcript_97035/m.296567 type:complete len:224 (-) Transcript_97035:907-1578(-)
MSTLTEKCDSTRTVLCRTQRYGIHTTAPTNESKTSACEAGLRTKFCQGLLRKTTISSCPSKRTSTVPAKPKPRNVCFAFVATSSQFGHTTCFRNTIISSGFWALKCWCNRWASASEAKRPSAATKGVKSSDKSKATSSGGCKGICRARWREAKSLNHRNHRCTQQHKRPQQKKPPTSSSPPARPMMRKRAVWGCVLNARKKASASAEVHTTLDGTARAYFVSL